MQVLEILTATKKKDCGAPKLVKRQHEAVNHSNSSVNRFAREFDALRPTFACYLFDRKSPHSNKSLNNKFKLKCKIGIEVTHRTC